MNALTRSVTNLPRTTSALTASHQTRMHSIAAVSLNKASSKLRSIWFSDAGAYPVMVTLGFAMVFCTWYGCYNLLSSPDIRINKDKRFSVVRTWGRGEW